jgi:hypothetical protein
MMASSMACPAQRNVRADTIVPPHRTAMSVVPPPMSTTMAAPGPSIANLAPSEAATGSAMR